MSGPKTPKVLSHEEEQYDLGADRPHIDPEDTLWDEHGLGDDVSPEEAERIARGD